MSATWNDLLSALRRDDLLVSAPAEGPALAGIGTDSRAMRPGMLYIAVRGTQADGHAYVADAVRRGAAAVLVEAPQETPAPQLVVADSRRAALTVARAWFADPASRLALVGVTGTNGKTTTTALVRHLLNGHGTAGSIGTLGAFDGAGRPVESTAGAVTTPGLVDLQATLAAMVARGVTHVAMETSSHSLHQGRLEGLTFAAGVFTNLTRDHLDYHGTMEDYLAAKLLLQRHLGERGVEVVNLDDPAWAALPPRSPRVTFGQHPAADVRASEVRLGAGGSTFRLSGRFGEAAVALPLLGDFNVANALGAAATALALGRPLAEVVERLEAAPQVPGRMERLATTPCVVLRDYAHTPDALARALETLRPLTPGRLVVVFGCGGDRDRGKRPEMGRIAAERADVAIVTSDNPRTEDPEAIIDDIVAGMAGTNYARIVDRLAAIERAIEDGRPGDTILLAGKGHEDYQVVGTEKRRFDEREIVQALEGVA
ncbi:MAG TPA: UDP-N-acetylmuramoyl-L-alanyl-D-glutamate--2,6-diaminopimelate ligase [Gemmatimonadales bacterium]|nr:UDP-N-acetylmuramoyl-L-alanyl-D-glutamate--2,6-diaminopimelate ligase [Gemmatimonadales bacterium]